MFKVSLCYMRPAGKRREGREVCVHLSLINYLQEVRAKPGERVITSNTARAGPRTRLPLINTRSSPVPTPQLTANFLSTVSPEIWQKKSPKLLKVQEVS